MSPVEKYSYRITWSEEDGEFVGLCAELPSLSWLAESQEAALKGIKKVVRDAVADMKANGEPVPEPLSTSDLLRRAAGADSADLAPPTGDPGRRGEPLAQPLDHQEAHRRRVAPHPWHTPRS